MTDRLTMTSDKGGVAFTFDLGITCEKSEIVKILKVAEKLKAYEEIGTVEECREARERQRGKKPNKSDVQPYFRKHCANIYSCPLCNKKLTYHKQKFCQYCGQAIDWSK